MSHTITCKYLKLDKFGNAIFLNSSESDLLKPGFDTSKILYKKLKKLYETNLPVYIKKKKGFSTIRVKKNPEFKQLKPLNIYSIEFTFNEVLYKGSKHININLLKWKLIQKQDLGKVINISTEKDDADDDEDSEYDDDE